MIQELWNPLRIHLLQCVHCATYLLSLPRGETW